MTLKRIREEIRFWRHLIERWEATFPEPAPERMREALETAERRLHAALADEGRERVKKAGPPDESNE